MLVLIFLVIFGAYYVVSSGWDSVSKAERELQSRQQELANLQREVDGIGSKSPQIAAQPSDQVLSRILPVGQDFQVQEDLSRLAIDHQLQAFRISPGLIVDPQQSQAAPAAQEPAAPQPPQATSETDELMKEFLHMPIELKFQSSYASLGNFVASLPQVKGLIAIQSIDIKRSGTRVEATIALKAYFKKA